MIVIYSNCGDGNCLYRACSKLLCGLCYRNKKTVVTKYFLCLHDTNMVPPITYLNISITK